MTTHLQREIENLKKKTLRMGAQAEEAVRMAVEALVNRDPKTADLVIASDEAMDHLEVDIEEDCLKLLALHQPVAVDLRYVVAILKINDELERVGDLAVNIAERAVYLSTHAPIDLPLDFRGMVKIVQRMLKESLDSLVNMDAHLARVVRASDDEVDFLNRQMYTLLEDYMKTHPHQIGESLHLLSATRHVERIGDKATNIAEDVIYMVEGEIVRHQPEVFSDEPER